MQVVMLIVSIALLGVIVFFVVSPKSSRLLRLSGIIALALIGLNLGVCGVFLLRGPREVEPEITIPFLEGSEPKPKEKTNAGVVVGYFLAFAAIFGLVAYSSIKEKEKKYEPAKKPVKNKAFQGDNEAKLDVEHDSGNDETFDIGVD